jgi:hypothetical protein
MRTVLVVRLDSAGDVLLAGPAIRTVAAHADRVVLLAGPRGRDAAALLPGVDKVVEWCCPWIAPEPEPVLDAGVRSATAMIRGLGASQAVIFTSSHQDPFQQGELRGDGSRDRPPGGGIPRRGGEVPGDHGVRVDRGPAGHREVEREQSLLAADAEHRRVTAGLEKGLPSSDDGAAKEAEDRRAGQPGSARVAQRAAGEHRVDRVIRRVLPDERAADDHADFRMPGEQVAGALKGPRFPSGVVVAERDVLSRRAPWLRAAAEGAAQFGDPVAGRDHDRYRRPLVTLHSAFLPGCAYRQGL